MSKNFATNDLAIHRADAKSLTWLCACGKVEFEIVRSFLF